MIKCWPSGILLFITTRGCSSIRYCRRPQLISTSSSCTSSWWSSTPNTTQRTCFQYCFPLLSCFIISSQFYYWMVCAITIGISGGRRRRHCCLLSSTWYFSHLDYLLHRYAIAITTIASYSGVPRTIPPWGIRFYASLRSRGV